MRQRLYRVVVAACLLTAVILGAFYFNSYDETPVVEKPVTLAEAFPDLPKNKVTLTLSSGQPVSYTHLGDGFVPGYYRLTFDVSQGVGKETLHIERLSD